MHLGVWLQTFHLPVLCISVSFSEEKHSSNLIHWQIKFVRIPMHIICILNRFYIKLFMVNLILNLNHAMRNTMQNIEKIEEIVSRFTKLMNV